MLVCMYEDSGNNLRSALTSALFETRSLCSRLCSPGLLTCKPQISLSLFPFPSCCRTSEMIAHALWLYMGPGDPNEGLKLAWQVCYPPSLLPAFLISVPQNGVLK